MLVDAAYGIYDRRIQRRDVSRPRTISGTILALERRAQPLFGARRGPGRPSYALVQQRQNHTRLWTMDDALRSSLSLSARLSLS